MPSTIPASPQDILTQKKRSVLAVGAKAATGTTIQQWNKRPTDVLSIRADTVDTVTPASAAKTFASRYTCSCAGIAKGTRTCCSA